MERREKHKTNALCHVCINEGVCVLIKIISFYYVLALASREAGYLHYMFSFLFCFVLFCFSKP